MGNIEWKCYTLDTSPWWFAQDINNPMDPRYDNHYIDVVDGKYFITSGEHSIDLDTIAGPFDTLEAAQAVFAVLYV